MTQPNSQSEFDGQPPQFEDHFAVVSARLAVVAAGGTVLFSSLISPVAGVLAGLGTLLLVVGITASRRLANSLGAVALFIAVVVAGIVEGPVGFLLGATIGAILAFDLSEQALTLGTQLGPQAATRRGELVHATASLGVGVGTAVLLVAIFEVVTGGFPPGVLIALLLAAIIIGSGLRS